MSLRKCFFEQTFFEKNLIGTSCLTLCVPAALYNALFWGGACRFSKNPGFHRGVEVGLRVRMRQKSPELNELARPLSFELLTSINGARTPKLQPLKVAVVSEKHQTNRDRETIEKSGKVRGN